MRIDITRLSESTIECRTVGMDSMHASVVHSVPRIGAAKSQTQHCGCNAFMHGVGTASSLRKAGDTRPVNLTTYHWTASTL